MRADVSYQTFFNHFATKQELVRELVRRGQGFLLGVLEAALRDGANTRDRVALVFAAIHEAAASVGPMHPPPRAPSTPRSRGSCGAGAARAT